MDFTEQKKITMYSDRKNSDRCNVVSVLWGLMEPSNPIRSSADLNEPL